MLMGNECKRNERNQIRRMPPCITSTRRFIVYLSTLYTFVRHQQRILMDLGKNSGRHVVILDGNTTKEASRLHHICRNNRGSLHQVALDMALHASQQQGSPAYEKLQRVLDLHPRFHIDMGKPVFRLMEETISAMLQGYGLHSMFLRPRLELEQRGRPNTDADDANVTLVETYLTESRCPISIAECKHHARVIIQTEQYFKPFLGVCHESPNCIVLEFSDHNKREAEAKGWSDSFFLLPVMNQHPSRLHMFEPKYSELKPLRGRTYDIVFFGTITPRRKALFTQSEAYLQTHQNSSNIIKYLYGPKEEEMAAAYADAKVCEYMAVCICSSISHSLREG